MPAFRYQQGYVVEYSEADMAGTSYLDGDDNYGSQLEIYRRSWQEPEDVGLSDSLYGQLEN
ncbi:hypothetical protein [Leptolyngbya iicbica]